MDRKPNPNRERARALANDIAQMSEAARTDFIAQCPIVLTIEGRPLSPHNCALAWSQDARVTLVGGFRQWINSGRRVRAGEKALYIFAPGRAKSDPHKPPGEISSAELSHARFFMVAVFDVSQTEAFCAFCEREVSECAKTPCSWAETRVSA